MYKFSVPKGNRLNPGGEGGQIDFLRTQCGVPAFFYKNMFPIKLDIPEDTKELNIAEFF